MFHSNYYGRLAAILARVPIRVITVHGVFEAQKHSTRPMMRVMDRSNIATITVSSAVKDVLVSNGCNPNRIVIITNGVEMPPIPTPGEREQCRSDLGLSPSTPIVSIVARLVPLKRHIDLLHALKAMPGEYSNTHLLIVGDGPERPSLETATKTLELNERVHFLGLRNDTENILKAVDIAVLCSDHEGLPLSLLESMAAGLPIVASNVGGVPEIIGAENGILIPARDVEALRLALQTLLAAPQQRLAMGMQNREKIALNYSSAAMTRQLETFYAASR
jgi:glycosyltransferase involved in cell wall biosynthesis